MKKPQQVFLFDSNAVTIQDIIRKLPDGEYQFPRRISGMCPMSDVRRAVSSLQKKDRSHVYALFKRDLLKKCLRVC